MMVRLQEARPGQIVSLPVLDSRGQTLVPAGSTLSETLINQLLARGLLGVDVEENVDDAERTERLAKERLRLETLFGTEPSSTELRQLKTALLKALDE